MKYAGNFFSKAIQLNSGIIQYKEKRYSLQKKTQQEQRYYFR